MASTSVSVIVPVYNEAPRIARSLERILAYLRREFSAFEVIAVNDGSTDGTAQELARFGGHDGRLEIVSFPSNRGKGFAVRAGMLRARGDVALFLDADLSTPVEETDKAIAELARGYSVVIGSRQHPDSVIHVHQNQLRERMGKLFNLWVRTLFSLEFLDTQCGFKGFCRAAGKEIFSIAQVDGFAFDIEVLIIARRLGYSIKEIPVSWSDAPGSKVKLGRDLAPVMAELLTIYWNDRRGLYNHHPAKP